jgi:EcsC protein family
LIRIKDYSLIARSEGEDLSEPESALSCLQVFALGGRTGSTDASESGYFAVRGMLAKSVTEAARFIAERGAIGPVLVRFITQVASRFGLVVTQKVAAQALPVFGTLGGAAVNYVYRAFSGRGSRSFHRSSARTNLRQKPCPDGI